MTPVTQRRSPYSQSTTQIADFSLRDHQIQKLDRLTFYMNSLASDLSLAPRPKERAITSLFPRAISLEAAERKMKRNLVKAACEHWNKENKETLKIADVFLILNRLLLKEIEKDEEPLRSDSPHLESSIKQMTSNVLTEVFSERTSPLPEIRTRWTPDSLYQEWADEEITLANPYLNPKKLQHSKSSALTETPSLRFHPTEYSNIGRGRPSMEDAHFFSYIEAGTLLGVFDGHGGADVAMYACSQFQSRFFPLLSEANGNVHRTFEQLFFEIENEINQIDSLMFQGCTAVISFIDKKNNVFTATLGDSEANIYKIAERKLTSIPLSVLRDWSSPKEAKRAAAALGDASIEIIWPLSTKPKHLRLGGLNISRTLGDFHIKTYGTGSPGVIPKPKITMAHLEPEDFLVLACDGLKDYVSEKEILKTLSSLTCEDDPATKLGLLALSKMSPTCGDNITILGLKVLNYEYI